MIEKEGDVSIESVDVDNVLEQMNEAGGKVNIVILDACRNNPFTRSFRSSNEGLAVTSAPSGTLIAYATSPGKTASDGEGQNGLYTEELLKAMKLPGLSIEEVFKRTGGEVERKSGKKQTPWQLSSIRGEFSFTGGTRREPNPSTAGGIADPAAVDLEYWNSIKTSNNSKDYQAYLEEFPQGKFRRLAQNKLDELASTTKPAEPTTTSPTNSSRLAKQYTNSLGMEFVLIPAGSFQMGSTNGKANEKPVHTITISQPFYLGKYEVMQKEWYAVMGSNPSFSKGDNLPVEYVSWNDVQEFIRLMNGKGDGTYRLPTEAEWEYACRAGTTGDYAGELDSMGWYNGNSAGKKHPVGQKAANAWGLYDMHGNVWEWCQDYYEGNYYVNSPGTDPQGAKGNSLRVVRGGSWNDTDIECRSANRHSYTGSYRGRTRGFRLVRMAR